MHVPSAGRREAGLVLLGVLVILFVVAASSTSFVWFMDQQQTRAGARLRSAAALAAAEAGVHRALSVLETATPDGSPRGRTWRPEAHVEPFQVGSFDGRCQRQPSGDPICRDPRSRRHSGGHGRRADSHARPCRRLMGRTTEHAGRRIPPTRA
jgi:hypothetical protein